MNWTSDTIRQLRTSAQMTQSQLARWLNVTVKQVKHLENRRRNPSGPVRRLLDILSEESGQNGAARTPLVQVLGSSSPRPKSPRPQSGATESNQSAPPATDAAMVWDS
jgi:transcriptional regulator with XRE-family HTH domain